MARIVIDNFFHMAPGHRLSSNIVVGGYKINYGRYAPFDIYHPNGLSMLLADLAGDNEVVFSNQPFSEVLLCGTDILIIPNPDYPHYEGTSPYRIDETDREVLHRFMERGGSVLLLVNSFYSRSDFWEENFDIERINPLFEKLGLEWDTNYMSDADTILPSLSGDFVVGYGQGGRVRNALLPPDAKPLLSYKGEIFGFTKPVGKGKIAVIGDAGLVSNGLYNFPGFDNKAFILDLIKNLAPEFCHGPHKTFVKHSFGNVSCGTNENGISETLFKTLRKNASFKVDHHYRHLVWDNTEGTCGPDDIAEDLPFDIGALNNNSELVTAISLLNACEGMETKPVDFTLKIVKKILADRTEYFITGNNCSDDLEWPDVGGCEDIAAVGKLLRVSSVIQADLAVSNDGSLLYATYRQGQILYIRNERNTHYGFDILLNSKGVIYSPAVSP